MRMLFFKSAGLLAAFVFSLSTAQAQQAVNWSGPYVTGFGQYSTGSSTQNDNGFVYNPPKPKPKPKPVTTPTCPPGTISLPTEGGGLDCEPIDVDRVNVTNADGRYGVSGGFGGGGIGYNYQFANTVVGIEGMIAAGRASGSSQFCGTPAHACGTSVDVVSDIRGRLGYSFGRLLPFIAGGLAVDHVSAYDSLFGAQGKGWMAGFTVGAGLEYKLTPHLSIRAEYLHTEIHSHYLFDIVPNVPERVGYYAESARVGLSYSFNSGWTDAVAARY